MDLKLKGKVAIVTGASAGIGKAIAVVLAGEGAAVAVNSRDISRVQPVVDEIQAAGNRALAIPCDVTNFQAAKAMADKVIGELGGVDILVNNVGGPIPGPGGFSYFWDKTEADWDAGIALNLKSVFNCCRAVINHMIEKRSGKIVNIASTSGTSGNPRMTDYSAAKAGVIGLTRTLAKEVVSYGVNVNSICPGPIATPLMMQRTNAKMLEYYRKLSRMPNGMGQPEDIAYLVAFLASDDASFITGQNHLVAGLTDAGGP